MWLDSPARIMDGVSNLYAILEGAQSLKRTADLVSTGFDMVKKRIRKNGKTETVTKKETHVAPTQIAHGWYADSMTGIKRKFPKALESILTAYGTIKERNQTGAKQDTQLSLINHALFINMNDITDLTTLKLGRVTNQISWILSTKWKTMFTNMSNVKICYEFYYVTPKRDRATNFLEEVDIFTTLLDQPDNYNDNFTNWSPNELPALMENWKILSKSVFRLGPGETGEIHGGDKLYYKYDQGAFTAQRNYIPGLNTQLYCRWYGAPTGVAVTGTNVVLTPAFGDAGLATVWITEKGRNWVNSDADNITVLGWSRANIAEAPGAGNSIVTNVETDQDVTPAE